MELSSFVAAIREKMAEELERLTNNALSIVDSKEYGEF